MFSGNRSYARLSLSLTVRAAVLAALAGSAANMTPVALSGFNGPFGLKSFRAYP